ncbi:type II secretion system F family protein [Thermaurantiacus tibetensis]|uniref:type II secretion system F family protein n=1 Tax=Thermaurantiacus tibetensis TaxID=2759035 RepID=UPI00188E2422|nr:type II secretion system F family protein [Thermaurantiacus tibetensis]
MNAPATLPRLARPGAGARLSAADRAALVRELATLVAVMPVSDAVDTLARQPAKPRTQAVLAEVNRQVKAGHSLAHALPPAAFPPDIRATVAAGEASGRLPLLLQRLADTLEAELALRSKLLAALAYPALLVLVAVSVIVGMLVFVVPGIAEQYAEAGAELPLVTRLILGASALLRSWGWVLGLLILAGLLAVLVARRREGGRARLDRALIATPVIGGFVAASEGVRFARLLGVMLAAGLPVAEALQLVAPAMRTRPWQKGTQAIAARVRAGAGFAPSLALLPRAPALLLSLARSGEASGRLAPLLDSAAQAIDRQLSDRSRVLLSLLEPLIIVVLGGVVGLIILAVLLPILRLNALASQAIGAS